ncbi:unnamed protein product [Hyaloperonospora brassicae]|uniref:RxLR effector candidate protein n=1 Tax=Hyaloperonospora brassicae TaxID=162125 RepID=A0AAV0T6Z5_HYABA|nr:unnamed protein product [Hyaloperonospora brassicae]
MRICFVLALLVATFVVSSVSAVDVTPYSTRDRFNERTKPHHRLRVKETFQEERSPAVIDIAETVSTQVLSRENTVAGMLARESGPIKEGVGRRPRSVRDHVIGGILALLTASALIGGGIVAMRLWHK